MSAWEFISRSADETRSLGRQIGKLAQPGDLYLLQGDLGAGKTTLTQGIAAGLEAPERVTSPTFVLINEYHGRIPIHHADLYRLASPEAVETTGIDEYVDGEGLLVVEWPERVADLLPEERLLITIRHREGDERLLQFEPTGERYQRLVDDLRKAIEVS